jgi:hypothetical protein
MKVTEKQAQQALKDINNYFNPKVPADLRDIIGAERMYTEPTLRFNESEDRWEVLWEDGPSQWAYRFSGDPSEETCILMQQAAQEFGHKYVRPEAREALVLKSGVEHEALYSFAVYLYKDQKVYN